MNTRWEIEQALRTSGLPAPARHVALTLLTYTDARTGEVPAWRTPTVDELRDATGLGRSTVLERLGTLEDAGWLTRDRRRRPTGYRLHVPEGAVVPPEAPHGAVPEPPVDPQTVQEPDPDSPGAGPSGFSTVQELDPTVQELDSKVQELDPDSPAPGPSIYLISNHQSSSSGTVLSTVATATGVDDDEAQRLIDYIRGRFGPASLRSYVHQLARAGDLPALLDEMRAATRPAPRPAADSSGAPPRGRHHDYADDPDAPGTCARCHLPAANAAHGGLRVVGGP